MERTQALITIVVTVYNTERYISRCLESLLHQDSQQFELLVVDDGSTDKSLQACRAVLPDGMNARLERRPHGGVAQARNYGLTNVRTKYALFLDGDDALEPGTVSRLNEIVKRDRPELVVFGLCYEPVSGGSYRVCPKREVFYANQREIRSHFADLWDSGLMYSACNKLFLVESIRQRQIQFQRMDFGEDFKFCRNVLRQCQSVVMTGACCYRYTCHTKGSLSTSYRHDLFEIRVREHLELTKYFEDVGCLDDRAREFLTRRHIERVVGCIENECSPYARKTVGQRIRGIRKILEEENTAACAGRARLASLKMKLLVLPIRRKWVLATYFLGCLMTFCRNRLPSVFVWLKMNR